MMKKGFTLIELMTAVSIFIIVMTISMGSIINILEANRKSRALKTVSSNLNLAVESMSKEMRFGKKYHCGTGTLTDPLSCPSGDSILSFLSSDGLQITYRLNGAKIEKDVNSGGYVAVTAPEIAIDSLVFYVLGAASNDSTQPKVVIKIRSHSGLDKSRADFTLQTLVSQRSLDEFAVSAPPPPPPPPPSPPTFPSSGLVAYWKMDEGSGTRFDSKGSNTLSDNNTVSSGSGEISNAAQFVGSNSEYLSVSNNSDLTTGDIDYSLAMWVYLDGNGPYGLISKDNEPAGTREYSLAVVSGRKFRWTVLNGASSVIGDMQSNAYSAGQWIFLYVYHNAATNKIGMKVNDVLVNEVSTTGAAAGTASPVYFGTKGDRTDYLDGRIDEVGFWKRVLTDQEVTDLYNGGTGLTYP